MLNALKQINSTSAFNRWAGIEVTRAESGAADLTMAFRAADMAQYAGFLHAGVIGALLDTACGFAAVTVAGNVLASHFSVNCLAPAVGEVFIVKGRVVKAGKKQVFACAELFAQTGVQLKLVATGDAILVPVESR